MKILKTLMFSTLLFTCALNASADNKNNLIYNSEEVNGVMVGQTVYKTDGNLLANYMKHNYKYDEQNRMTESETLKWNSDRNQWEKDICIHYLYQGKTITTEYYKWSKKKGQYVLQPEMTVTRKEKRERKRQPTVCLGNPILRSSASGSLLWRWSPRVILLREKNKTGRKPCLSIGMKLSIRILNSFLLSSVPVLPGSLALTALPQYGSTS